MNIFDQAISVFMNRIAQQSALFDQIVVFLSNSDLVKGGVVVGALWAVWFFKTGDSQRNRNLLLGAILGSLFALFLARVLAYVAPMRIRPLLEPALHFQPPIGLPSQTNWTSWSSFPSDHAALFFALAWGVWRASKRVGTVLLLYVIIMICLPRLYVGIHYATDVIAGAVIGIGFSMLFSIPILDRFVLRPLLKCEQRWPGAFYFLLFTLTFEIASLFWDVRVALSLADFSV